MRSLHLTSVAGLLTIPTGGDMAMFGACSMPHGLQGFLPHLSGYVGGHQHGAECARSSKTLSSGKGAKASVSVPLRSHRQAESQDCWTRFGRDDACLVASHSYVSRRDPRPSRARVSSDQLDCPASLSLCRCAALPPMSSDKLGIGSGLPSAMARARR